MLIESPPPGVRNPNLSMTIAFNSKGLTAGILNVGEIPEEKETLGERKVEGGREEDEDILEETKDTEEVFGLFIKQ